MKRLAALESARGLLALWVLLGHVVSRTYSDAELDSVHLSILHVPIWAVYVFIMLSGFVITYLLDHESLDYSRFVIRRFLRLAQLWTVVVILSALTLPAELRVLQSLTWSNEDTVGDVAFHQEAIAHFWAHLIAHLSMLHGMIPPQ